MYPQIWPITLISSSYLITDLPCSRSVPPLSCNLSGKQLEAFWGAAPLHFVCAPCLEYMNVNFKLYDPFSLRTIWHVPEGRVCEFHSSACCWSFMMHAGSMSHRHCLLGNSLMRQLILFITPVLFLCHVKWNKAGSHRMTFMVLQPPTGVCWFNLHPGVS